MAFDLCRDANLVCSRFRQERSDGRRADAGPRRDRRRTISKSLPRRRPSVMVEPSDERAMHPSRVDGGEMATMFHVEHTPQTAE